MIGCMKKVVSLLSVSRSCRWSLVLSLCESEDPGRASTRARLSSSSPHRPLDPPLCCVVNDLHITFTRLASPTLALDLDSFAVICVSELVSRPRFPLPPPGPAQPSPPTMLRAK